MILMKNRAYRFERDIYREEDRRQFHHGDQRSATKSDRCDEDYRRSTHKFNSRDRSRTTDNCDRFHSLVETEDRSSRAKRSRNNRFNFRSRNSHNCSQPYRNKRGW